MFILKSLSIILLYWMAFSAFLMVCTIGLGWFRKEEPDVIDVEENIDEDYI